MTYLLFHHCTRQNPAVRSSLCLKLQILPVKKMHCAKIHIIQCIKYDFVTTVNKGDIFKNFFTGRGQRI